MPISSNKTIKKTNLFSKLNQPYFKELATNSALELVINALRNTRKHKPILTTFKNF